MDMNAYLQELFKENALIVESIDNTGPSRSKEYRFSQNRMILRYDKGDIATLFKVCENNSDEVSCAPTDDVIKIITPLKDTYMHQDYSKLPEFLQCESCAQMNNIVKSHPVTSWHKSLYLEFIHNPNENIDRCYTILNGVTVVVEESISSTDNTLQKKTFSSPIYRNASQNELEELNHTIHYHRPIQKSPH